MSGPHYRLGRMLPDDGRRRRQVGEDLAPLVSQPPRCVTSPGGPLDAYKRCIVYSIRKYWGKHASAICAINLSDVRGVQQPIKTATLARWTPEGGGGGRRFRGRCIASLDEQRCMRRAVFLGRRLDSLAAGGERVRGVEG